MAQKRPPIVDPSDRGLHAIFMFPIANMPPIIQGLTYLNPLRYFLVIVRGIFLKGIGLEILWPQMVALAVLGVITLWLASRRFRKTVG